MTEQIACRYFNGYKPCGKNSHCSALCEHRDLIEKRILIVHLGALGAVVRATAILNSVHKKYAHAHVTWVTDKPAHHLLAHNPKIDRVLTTESSDLLSLTSLQFDVALVLDKSLKASGVLKQTQVEKVFGFVADQKTGAIVPASAAAQELWKIGLNDELKFFKNTKTEVQLLIESMELGPYERADYDVPLNESERELATKRKNQWKGDARALLGFNTGCATTIPYKKWTVQKHIEVISAIHQRHPNLSLALLGGPEDETRNKEIHQALPYTILTPTTQGLRDGMVSTEAMDLVITGDSLGMHMAIACKKYVIAWFGPTCAHEIDLYDRGEFVMAPVDCGPCWKHHCEKNVKCHDLVSADQVLQALERGLLRIT